MTGIPLCRAGHFTPQIRPSRSVAFNLWVIVTPTGPQQIFVLQLITVVKLVM